MGGHLLSLLFLLLLCQLTDGGPEDDDGQLVHLLVDQPLAQGLGKGVSVGHPVQQPETSICESASRSLRYRLVSDAVDNVVAHHLARPDDALGVCRGRVHLLVQDAFVEVAVGGGEVTEDHQPLALFGQLQHQFGTSDVEQHGGPEGLVEADRGGAVEDKFGLFGEHGAVVVRQAEFRGGDVARHQVDLLHHRLAFHLLHLVEELEGKV
jgi:hypothetical protein